MTGAVKRTSMMPERPHLCAPALIVFSTIGRTWFWTLSFATPKIILLRSSLRVTSLWSNHELALFCCHRDGGALAVIGCSDWTCDQLNLGGVAAVEDLERQIPIYVDVSSDLGSVSWSDSRCYTGSHRVGDALVLSFRRHVVR